MDKKDYGVIGLPKELVNDLKTLKIAFQHNYNRPMTYEDIIRQMIAGLEDGDPAVYEDYSKMKLKMDK